MTEENTAAEFNREGGNAFGNESTDEDTSADSQSENENQEEGTQSSDGDNSQNDDKDTPFHEHPRWKQREDEWNTRFNDQETRHQDDLKAIREEFGTARKENAEATKIPAWFGGTQEQWDAYRADRDAELKAAGENAVKAAQEALKTEKGAESKAVAEATDFMKSEMVAIEGDKTLNPSGAKIDKATAEKLLKTVLENELIDTKGRWNYRAGWRLMNAGVAPVTPAAKPNTSGKKQLAGASTSDTRGGDSKNGPAMATSETFKKDRPW